MRAANHRGSIGSKIDHDKLRMDKNRTSASVAFERFFQETFKSVRQHCRRLEICGSVSVKPGDRAAFILNAITKNCIVGFTKESVLQSAKQIERSAEENVPFSLTDFFDKILKV